MEYRFHLLNTNRGIIAIDLFEAESQVEALRVAAAIFAGCGDIVAACELWSGPEVVATEHHVVVRRDSPAAALRLKTQLLVCEREECLRDSYACLRESRLLLASLTFLRHVPRRSSA